MVERLRALAADRTLTAADISITLTADFDRIVSRNAVLGQSNRHRIRIGQPRRTPTETKQAAARERVQRLSAAPRAARPKPPSTKVMAPPPKGHVAGDPWPDDVVHWPGREAPPHGRQCQWPIGHVADAGFGFCGRNVAARIGEATGMARTYCKAHLLRGRATPRERQADATDSGQPETAA
jgi:hypothetical protein